MANYTNRGSHYKAASREEKRRPWRRKGLAVLACLLAVAFAAGVAALAVPGLFRSGDEATLTKTIYWWDNDNEDGKRPGVDKYEKPLLVLKDENGNQYMSDNDDEQARALLKSLNYPDGWPEVVVAPDQGNTWKVTTKPEQLNTIVYQVDEETGELVKDNDGNPVPTDNKVTWSLSQGFPPEVEGYTAIYAELQESLEGLFGSFSEVGPNDWHYIKDEEYTFTIDLRSGSLENLSGITDAILQQFELEASFTAGGEQKTPHVSLAELEGEPGYATVQFQVKDDGDEEWENIDLDNPDAMKEVHDELRLSLTMPKYTIEGQPITYKVAEADENKNNRLEYQIPDFEGTDDKDDYFAIKYDNTNATNHGSATDGAYSGGSVILTLTGTTEYEATKVWQDKDRDENTARPKVTLELWRYVAGQPLESAAAVRDSQGNIYTYDVSKESDSGEGMAVTFHDKDAEGQPLEEPADFPKYDPEGNRYIYVVKEYGLDGNYTQVFGEIDPDGDVSGDFIKEDQDGDGVVENVDTRTENNTYLYNGGTLNNVLNGTTTATATKVWNASAFQAEFGGVTVELTLQSRPSKEGQGAEEGWTNTNETYSLTGFQAENLAGLSYSGAFPQYDNLGRKLEYRWVETNVTQVLTDENGSVIDTVKTDFKQDENGTATFTLQQTDSTGTKREVQYTSVSKGPDEEGNTTITNSVANTVEYEVDKWWALTEEEVEELADKLVSDKENYYQNENGQWYTKDLEEVHDDTESATFYLYRVESGEQVPMDEPGGYYLSFTMSKDGDPTTWSFGNAAPAGEQEQITITPDEDTPWHVNITGLPEFDEGGRQYDYVLVEANASPRYETTRESEGYSTTVYNPRGPGEVLQILVQKNWIDDSDTVHREPVVIKAHKKSTGEEIEDASVTLENGLWYDWITIKLGSSVGDGNNPEDDEENETFETIETDETIEDGEIDKDGEPTQPDDGTGDEVQTGGETETDGNTDVTTQPGEENDETEEITNTDSDTPEESEVSESLLANEGEELAAPNQADDDEHESKTPDDGGTPGGDAGNVEAGGVQSIDDIYLLEYSIGGEEVTNTLKDGDLSDGIDEGEELWYERVTGDVTSQYHRYQVTYSKFTPIESSDYKYSATVTNRRLGNIDITVHKVWNSGEIENNSEVDDLANKLASAKIPGAEKEGASLALKLDFHESTQSKDYKIEKYEDNKADEYITLGDGTVPTTIYNVKREVGTAENPVSSDESFGPDTDRGSSVIEINLPGGTEGEDSYIPKEQYYYFSNLPKYDTTGTIVRYAVEEGLKSEDGKFISFEDYIAQAEPGDALAKELKKWVHTMEEGEYVTAFDPDYPLEPTSTKDVDFQEFKATNSLTGTKDVQWYKEWNDAYRNQEGERPDIFLDVFRLVHETDETTKLELVVKDYQWTPTTTEGEGEESGPVDAVNNWTATMEGVPLYDSLGYKITYFAVERAVGDTEMFDYGPVRYYMGETKLGDRLTVEKQYLEETPDGVLYACSLKDENGYVEVANMGDETLADRYRDRTVNYALGEGGTFENYLRADPNLAGSKLWQGVESGYPTDQLPQVTFALYQTTLGKETEPENPDGETDPENPGEEVATLQVNWGGDFGMLNGSLTTDFRFFMKGDWKVDWKDDLYVYTQAADDGSTKKYYVNSDWEVVDENDNNTVIELPDDVRLPQYDKEGNRYAYTMVEKSITLKNPNYTAGGDSDQEYFVIKLDPKTGKPDMTEGVNTEEAIKFYESIFTDAKVTEGTFQATNVYNDEQNGQLAVEKWLNVGKLKEDEQYPAIQVKLSRAVTSQKDNADAWRLVDSHIWGSDTVEKAFTSGETTAEWGHLEYTFDGLPIYAPNGEKYVYKVVEVKDGFLAGYNTWAVKGTVEKGDLNEKTNKDNLGEVVSDLEAMKVTEGTETTPDTATFINKRDADSVKLQGTKVWDDWKDAMELRPDNANDITLTVSRRADAQPGMNNPIELQALDKNSYEVEWTISDSGDTWTYTITGKDGGELERYAPNGMPWIYQVTEKIGGNIVGVYVPSPGTATFEPGETTGQLDAATDLKNSLKTSVTFQKQWVDEDNKEISTDYFGEVTVDFKLQVAFAGEDGTATGEWQDAETFFTNNTENTDPDKVYVPSSVLNMGTYQFEGSTNEANGWKGTFSGLPRAVKVGEETKILTYRVVETKVTYTLPGEEPTTVEVEINGDTYNVTNNGTFTGAELESNGATWITTNTMKTVDLKITKIWDDQNNKYGTRPEGENGKWKVDFIIQYQDPKDVETGEYHNVTTKDGEPLIVSISSTELNQDTTTVKDLPFVAGRQYYAFELNPGHEAADEGPEGFRVTSSDEAGPGYYHHNMYEASYTGPTCDGEGNCTTTVTNTLRTTQVTAVKEWKPAGKEPYPQVTLELRYVEKWLDDNTPELSEPIDTVVLDGTDGNWEYTWENIPLYHPDDPSIETGETTYQVVELGGEGYVLVEGPEEGTDNEGYKTFTFTNKPVVDFTVEKKWDQPPAGYENWKVTVQLYRTTGEGEPTDEAYKDPVTLTAAGGWKHTWSDLDKYYEDEGEYKAYNYYVREVSISDGSETNTLTEQGTIQVGDTEFVVSYDTTKTNAAIIATITNRPVGTCSVEKVWWNEGGTTPVSVTVGLYQETDNGIGPVMDKDSKPITITLPYEGKWSHTWTDLYKYDADGTAIRYVVRELDEDGNPVSNGDSVTVDGTDYTVYYDGFTIHNVREVDLTIEKTVTGDAADPGRQFTFEVGFTYDEDMPAGSTGPYAYTVYDAKTKEPVEGGTDTIPSAGGTISLTGGQRAVIEGLPAGTEYTVTEREANQDGYVTTPTDGKVEGTITVGGDNTASFTNCRAPGDLIIRKEVTGSGDRSKEWEFHISVTPPSDVELPEKLNCVRNGQPETLDLDENGYATFTLHDGESLEIKDLPNGTVFTVTEAGANQGGYTTKVEGTGALLPNGDGRTGKIDADGNNLVIFINDKPGGGGPGPGPTPTPTPEPEETPTPEPGESPTPAPEGSPSPEPSGTPGPDGTPTPAPSGSPSPSGSPTPGPGGSPTPAPTPTPPGGDTPDDTPQTGDPTHTLWWALAGAGALAGLGALWATRAKGHKARHRKK